MNKNQLYLQLHPKNNLTEEAFLVLNGRTRIWWQCTAGHEWEAKIQTRLGGKGNCPICIKTIESQCSLAHLFPEIAKDWYSRNPISAYSISPGSKIKVWWECRTCLHKWQTQVRSRTANGTGCPNCYIPNRSEKEIRISFELSYCFEQLDISDPKLLVGNKFIYVDILFPPQYMLAIEYDGATTHANSLTKDIEKNEKLTKLGYKVVRIREKPLIPTSPLDILIDKNISTKKCVDQVLNHLRNVIRITSPHHDAYLKRKLCINTAKADTFISQQKFNKFVKTGCDLAKTIEFDNQISLNDTQMKKLQLSMSKFSQRKERYDKTRTDQFLAALDSMKFEMIPKLEAALRPSSDLLSFEEKNLLKAKKYLRSQENPPPQTELPIPSLGKPLAAFEKAAPPESEPKSKFAEKFAEKSDEQLLASYRKYNPSLDATDGLAEAKKMQEIIMNLFGDS
jgi:hypothetical protein